MEQRITKEIIRFEHHLPGGKPYEAYDWEGECCQRCGERLVKYKGQASWSGVDEPEDAPCIIEGDFSPDGKVLYQIWAEDEWIASEAFGALDLKLGLGK